ncbi:hypothetical protein IEQ_00676 [Bacillus cereus BAG6X1-2]|nr:hypothetical protein IEQ_00676 [Bacillus cereus BAG6X1-2]
MYFAIFSGLKSTINRFFISGDAKTKEEATINIMWHLQEKGYSKSDIQKIEPFFNSKQTQSGANVKFKDEPGKHNELKN